MKCPKCDLAGIPDDAESCPQCRVPFQSGAQPSTKISFNQNIGSLAGGNATGLEVGNVTGNVIVEFNNNKPDTRTEAWLRRIKNNPVMAVLIISGIALVVITVGTISLIRLYRFVFPVELEQEKKLSRSITKLGSNDIQVRLAGLQAIQRISETSENNRARVIDAMCTFVKTQAPWQPGEIRTTTAKDVQLALDVLAQVPKKDSKGKLLVVKMPNIDISGADLAHADFEGAELWGSNMRGVILYRANLRRADLGGVDFTGASLEGANLEEALLYWSVPLPPVRPCVFDQTRLAGANFKNANLEGAILSQAIDLTREQIRQAKVNENTRLPLGMTLP